MAKDNKKLVQAITSQEENFAQWYTDICVKAELVEYSSVKGFIILRPYGQAIWELIQKDMDARVQATRHENRADKWAIRRLIPVAALDDAIASGHTDLWDLADYFGVTDSFLKKTLCLYVHGNLATELYFF